MWRYVVRDLRHSPGSSEAMASLSGSPGALGDILSLAMKQTGVSSGHSPQQQQSQLTRGEANSFLNQATDAIDDSFHSSDISTFTQGLFEDFAPARSSSDSQVAQQTTFSPGLERVASVTSPAVNGINVTGPVHTPSRQFSNDISHSLSMPVLFKPEATTEQYQRQQTTFPQTVNSPQTYGPGTFNQTVSGAVSTPVNSVNRSFSAIHINGGVQQPSVSSGFGVQGGSSLLSTNSSNPVPHVPQDQVEPSPEYDYRVLHDDNIDLDGLDEFLAADPMDIPPSSMVPHTGFQQNHQANPPPPLAYSSQQASPQAGGLLNGGAQNQLYPQSGCGGSVLTQQHSLNSTSSPELTSSPFTQQFHQQQQFSGIQQANMAPSYQRPSVSMMSPQFPVSRPLVQPVVSSMSMNGSHYSTSATDLSNIMPSADSFLSPVTTNGEMVPLSQEEIHNILELDDWDLNFDSNVSTDPFSSLDLIQPSNQDRFNGSTTAALVSSSAGSAVNAPSLPSYGTPQPQRQLGMRSSYLLQQQQRANFTQKLNIHNSQFPRGVQAPSRPLIQRARLAGQGRGAGIPMPPQGMVSHVDIQLLLLCDSHSLY